MNENLTQFSEATKVYAKYSAVVDQMYAAFQSDLAKFLDLILARARANVESGDVEEDGISGRNWYIWKKGWPEEWYVPYLWISANDPQIVTSNILTVEVRAEGTLKPHQDRLRSVLSAIPLPKNCSKAAGNGGLLFRVTIPFSESEEMVAAVAEPIWTLLTAMDNEFRKIQQTKE
jgi:hypothetical protein